MQDSLSEWLGRKRTSAAARRLARIASVRSEMGAAAPTRETIGLERANRRSRVPLASRPRASARSRIAGSSLHQFGRRACVSKQSLKRSEVQAVEPVRTPVRQHNAHKNRDGPQQHGGRTVEQDLPDKTRATTSPTTRRLARSHASSTERY